MTAQDPMPSAAPAPTEQPADQPAEQPAEQPGTTPGRRSTSKLLMDPSSVTDRARTLLHTVDDRHAVLIELNLSRDIGADDVRESFLRLFAAAFGTHGPEQPIPVAAHYLRCMLSTEEIATLGERDHTPVDGPDTAPETIYRIWPDYVIQAHIDRSAVTVKADAALRTYAAAGEGVVWAVIDSGIDKSHPHFSAGTLTSSEVARLHRDFTPLLKLDGKVSTSSDDALVDLFGHGTHVAGIIAGGAPPDSKLFIAESQPTTDHLPRWKLRQLAPGRTLTGIASRAKIVSLKVLDDNGSTLSSTVIEALAYIRKVNSGGRKLRIHGLNMSIGCDWFSDEFAAGQSPLCRELNLLVDTGVVAVVSAGNSGAGSGNTTVGGSGDIVGQLSSITDPGNAAQALTVGSTHRYEPHTYGISYTSSKGPTLDGRLKPDLVAPGERVTSAATGKFRSSCPDLLNATGEKDACYVEGSGTSMAAPHVSGAIAAFLSARPEYIGQPAEVKQLFMTNATSLDRHPFYQGAGLVDLMRVLSNV